MAFGMGKAMRRFMQSSEGIRFSDVAGEDEAKENLSEIVDYLHNPEEVYRCRCVYAKRCPSCRTSGNRQNNACKKQWRVNQMYHFSQCPDQNLLRCLSVWELPKFEIFSTRAKEKAPCIVFIDEMDAIGKSVTDKWAGNDEREQTLNQLLTEMDGFEGNNGVIILAATNHPESLDPALTRPGRFDGRVPVELPELANIINEAALRAVRSGRTVVNESDLEESIEVVIVEDIRRMRFFQIRRRRLLHIMR